MKHSILIVEDSLEMQELLRLLLEPLGYHVVSATTAKYALDILRTRNDFMLMLLDLTLPDMRAQLMIEQLRNENLAINIPILYFSAVAQLNELLFPAGVVGIIHKPFHVQSFLNTIASFKKHKKNQMSAFTLSLLRNQTSSCNERLTS